ncbi:HD domain-containing protein [Candidatus Bathyarchaeota archaeon]|nr:HD domain-containing protein [Candidatus Bathyarchaeota archaeon]
MEKLVELAGLIADDGLRENVLAFLMDPPTDLDQPALPVGVCPAGAYQHHSYRGGLVEHTLNVVKLCRSLCDIVEEQYGGRVDRDLVLAGAVLHDIMKVYCYEETGGGGFRTSEFGGLVDHLSLMIAEMYKRGLPLDLVHVVAGHHGDAGPTKPKTLEALIVSVADQADSDLNGKLLHAAEYLLRRSGVSRPVLGSAKEALDVVQVKSREGWEGLQRMLGDDG